MQTSRRLQLEPSILPGTKLKSKWIKDLKINPATLILLEYKVGNNSELIGTGDPFLNISPVAQTLRSPIDRWDLLKLRNFCETFCQQDKMAAHRMGKIITNPTSDRGLISKIYKELKKLVTKTPNHPIKNGVQI